MGSESFGLEEWLLNICTPRAVHMCNTPLAKRSASTWMVSSDAAAWCVCPCIFRSTNKIYMNFTQQFFFYFFHKTMCNKTITEFGFYDIRINQGLGKCNQPRSPNSADYTCLDIDYSGFHKNLIQLLFIISNAWGESSDGISFDRDESQGVSNRVSSNSSVVFFQVSVQVLCMADGVTLETGASAVYRVEAE